MIRRKPKISECKIMSLPKICDQRGNLTFIESCQHIPFSVERVFYIYDIPTGESRGAHAHFDLQQFLICLSGSFDVIVNDGKKTKKIHLNRPWEGLYIPNLIWANETNFDPGSVCLVLASDKYKEDDYIRSYEVYQSLIYNRDHGVN